MCIKRHIRTCIKLAWVPIAATVVAMGYAMSIQQQMLVGAVPLLSQRVHKPFFKLALPYCVAALYTLSGNKLWVTGLGGVMFMPAPASGDLVVIVPISFWFTVSAWMCFCLDVYMTSQQMLVQKQIECVTTPAEVLQGQASCRVTPCLHFLGF